MEDISLDEESGMILDDLIVHPKRTSVSVSDWLDRSKSDYTKYMQSSGYKNARRIMFHSRIHPGEEFCEFMKVAIEHIPVLHELIEEEKQ